MGACTRSRCYALWQASRSGGKPQQRKGGLSMFLSGALESPLPPAAPVTPMPAPRRTTSWATAVTTAAAGGMIGRSSSRLASVPSLESATAAPVEASAKPAPVSLLEIQQAEAAAASASAAARPRTSLLSGAIKAGRLPSSGHSSGGGHATGVAGMLTHAGDAGPGTSSLSAGLNNERPGSSGGHRIPLSQFIHSSPAPIPEASGARPAATEAAPAWGGAAGASPTGVASRPSLRDIQARSSHEIDSFIAHANPR